MITSDDLLAGRTAAGQALADQAEAVARTCFAMAQRFAAGATMFAFGTGASATDAQHVAVEFVHPVVVGKRALPALSLATDTASVTGVAAAVGFDEVFAHQVRHLGRPGDIALGLTVDGRDRAVLRGLEVAHDAGLLTVALTGGDGAGSMAGIDHHLHVPSADGLVVKELHVTTYHVLWELVHVFFEHPGVLAESCITCSDQAVDVVIMEVLPDGLARVDTGAGVEEISIALVDAGVGDHVLVHAGEAIAVVPS